MNGVLRAYGSADMCELIETRLREEWLHASEGEIGIFCFAQRARNKMPLFWKKTSDSWVLLAI